MDEVLTVALSFSVLIDTSTKGLSENASPIVHRTERPLGLMRYGERHDYTQKQT
jgi:hypothetical protein